MATDYGLSAMTGILPVGIMAGVNVAVIKELFPQGSTGRGYSSRPSQRRRSIRRQSRRTSGSLGNFSNVGF